MYMPACFNKPVYLNVFSRPITGKSCIVRHTNNGSTINFDTKFSLNFTYVYMYKYEKRFQN